MDRPWGTDTDGADDDRYESNSSGRYEVYVRPFPNVGDGQWQLSTGGGVQALWAKEGRELFYAANDGTLMTVPVTAGDGAWRVGTPTVVLKGGYYMGAVIGLSRQDDVSSDGRRFLDDHGGRRWRRCGWGAESHRCPKLAGGVEGGRSRELTISSDSESQREPECSVSLRLCGLSGRDPAVSFRHSWMHRP